MHIDAEDKQQKTEDKVMACLVIYCTLFLFSVWIADQIKISLFFPLTMYVLCTTVGFATYYFSRASRQPPQDFGSVFCPLLHRHKPRHVSIDSGYNSNYGAITQVNDSHENANNDRFYQLSTLRQQEKVLKAEVEELNGKAKVAYKAHSNTSQYFCDHDPHKTECSKVLFDGFKDASRAWYAADRERTAKKKELQNHQQKIRDLKAEMEIHFYDAV